MRIAAIIDKESRFLCEITTSEIAKIMGKNSIYNETKFMQVGALIPIEEQYENVQNIKNMCRTISDLKNKLEVANKEIDKAIEFAERLNINK